MEFLCLMGLGLVFNLIFINLMMCVIGSFRKTEPEYYEKLKQYQEEAKAKTEKVDGATLKQNQGKNELTVDGKKLKGPLVIEANKENLLSIEKVEGKKIEKKGEEVFIKSTDNQQENRNLSRLQIGNNPVTSIKKKIAASSRMYSSSYFAAKPLNKVAPIKASDISKCLDELRDGGRLKNLKEIDDKDISRFRDKGLLSEFNRPLRNYNDYKEEVPDDVTLKTGTNKKK